MNIFPYKSFFTNYKNNQIIKKSISIDLSQDYYKNNNNNKVNDILKFIHNRKIFNPYNSSRNYLKDKKKSSLYSKNKLPKSNSFTRTSNKPITYNYSNPRNNNINFIIYNTNKNIAYNNYKELFKSNDKKSKSVYYKKKSKQE